MSAMIMHALTDVGLRRSQNEDCVGTCPEFGFTVLADGMGGHNAGEVASSLAVDVVSRILKSELPRLPEAQVDDKTGLTRESLLARQAVTAANQAIFDMAQQRSSCTGMGTTVVAAVFFDDRISIVNVGDSRMYRLRNDILTHLTEDHSLIQEQVRRGLVTLEDARHSTIKNVVTRALGVDLDVEPDIVEDVVRPGDLYLQCSDGLTDVVPDEAIRLTLAQNRRDLQAAATQLVALANDAGGPDNISVVLTLVRGSYHRKRTLLSRLLKRHA